MWEMKKEYKKKKKRKKRVQTNLFAEQKQIQTLKINLWLPKGTGCW